MFEKEQLPVGINTFGSAQQADSVSPSEEPVFILTSSEIQGIIAKAIQPIQAELTTLKEDLKRFKIYGAPQKVDDLWEWVEDIDCRVQHIKPKDLRGSTSSEESMDRIVEALQKRKNGPQYITYTQVAGILDVSEARVCQLRADIQKDKRLVLSWHPINKRLRIITLTRLEENDS